MVMSVERKKRSVRLAPRERKKGQREALTGGTRNGPRMGYHRVCCCLLLLLLIQRRLLLRNCKPPRMSPRNGRFRIEDASDKLISEELQRLRPTSRCEVA